MSLQIEFRSVPHIYDEMYMGHKIFFVPDPRADAISATANSRGYTPLTAIARCFDWDRSVIAESAYRCNSRSEVTIVKEVDPLLILVPKIKESERAAQLTRDLMNAVDKFRIEVLHFTHFCFTQSKKPMPQIEALFTELGYFNEIPDKSFHTYPHERIWSRRIKSVGGGSSAWHRSRVDMLQKALGAPVLKDPDLPEDLYLVERAAQEKRLARCKSKVSSSRCKTPLKLLVWDYDFRFWFEMDKFMEALLFDWLLFTRYGRDCQLGSHELASNVFLLSKSLHSEIKYRG